MKRTPMPPRRTPLPRGVLRHRSPRKSADERKYAAVRGEYLAEHPVCERCTFALATDLHHRRGRGVWLCAVEFFAALCRPCHDHIESHRADAYAEGWLIRRNQRSAA